MHALQERMARSSFGFGKWDAPYWFIGPEQGKGRGEAPDNTLRSSAWERLGCAEVCDCREFHDLIGEDRWHARAQLQKTWSSLIRLLLTYMDRPADNESVRAYQRDEWGSSRGETCVIELSGLAARSLSTPTEREIFREERIEMIRSRMERYRPELVVMYGAGQIEHWRGVAGCEVRVGEPARRAPHRTILACTNHPVAHGVGTQYWLEFGEKLRRLKEHVDITKG